jgi:hypothetical protein
MLSLCASMSRIVGMPWLATALLLCGDAAMADINKWIDPAGRVNYGDHPPSWADTMSVSIRPNVIETDPIGLRTTIAKALEHAELPADQAAAETRVDLGEHRWGQALVQHCQAAPRPDPLNAA